MGGRLAAGVWADAMADGAAEAAAAVDEDVLGAGACVAGGEPELHPKVKPEATKKPRKRRAIIMIHGCYHEWICSVTGQRAENSVLQFCGIRQHACAFPRQPKYETNMVFADLVHGPALLAKTAAHVLTGDT